jgi:hypothetical protein
MNYIPMVVCLIGLIAYSISDNPKLQAIAKDMFWTGLLVTLLQIASQLVKLPS